MSVTTILLIGAGVILLLWLMIWFKLFKIFAEVLDGILDAFN